MTHKGAPQFPLRFPNDATRDRLKTQAKANHRTMNGEILHRLEVYEREFECEIISEEELLAQIETLASDNTKH